MNRVAGYGLLCCMLACAAAGLTAESARASDRRPNLLIILADDQGWGDLSVHGNTNLATPNIDSLARNGALFDRFYVCSVCAPTRAEFLTGRYHSRGGVRGVTSGAERLNLDETTIAQTFRSAGYATGAFGKWHNGTQYPYHPNARGFEEFYGFCSGHWGQYFDTLMEHNGTLLRGKGFIIDDLTDHALAFIERNKDRPFFCYMPYNTPHSPFQVPDRFYDKFKGSPIPMRFGDPKLEDLETTRTALAMCENIDWNVGRLLRKLKELRLEDNTVVIYFSDNGPNSWRWNGGMKGRKGSTDEGGVRVPFLIRWPGRVKPGTTVREIAAAIDILPTVSSLAGVPLPGRVPLDGKNLEPLLSAKDDSWPDRMIFSHQNGQVSVRTRQYRLDNLGRLFDMAADPSQEHDISGEKPEVTAQLVDAVAKWRAEVLPKSPDDRPFPVGYPEFPSTPLPARDGVFHGGIQRSARAPNSSYFTNWKTTQDRMTWEIEVATDGDYEAVIHYTCPASSVGSTVELSFNGSRLDGLVSEAHDPPLVGARFDRVPREGESYVKDFRPLRLGTMRLEKGRGPLTLRALAVAREQVMDVRAVVLTLMKKQDELPR